MPPRKPKPQKIRCKKCGKSISKKHFARHLQQHLDWNQDVPSGDEFADLAAVLDSPEPIHHPVVQDVSPASSHPPIKSPALAPWSPGLTLEEPIIIEGDMAPESDIPEPEEAGEPLRPVEEEEERPWYDDYEVTDVGPIEDIGEEEETEFEALMEWIDMELELEVAENYRYLLTADDKRHIKMFALRYRHNMTKLFHTHLATIFREELSILTAHMLSKRMLQLAGWQPERHPCCEKSCMAYTGPYKDLDACPYCHTARGKHFYTTLPLKPQLSALYSGDGEVRKKMNHTREMLETYQAGQYRDIHDGKAVRDLLGKKVVVNGKEKKHTYFEDPRDIPLGMMTDGFSCFKRVHRGQSSAWPVILINYGRSSLDRMRIENIIPFSIIPGPSQPKDFNSFLYPLRSELNMMATGVNAYDSEAKEMFKLHAYLVVAVGDMPAVKHFSYMKGPGAIHPCRACKIQGFYHPARRKYYTPLRSPKDATSKSNRKDYKKEDKLDMRTAVEIRSQMKEIRDAPTETAREQLGKDYGISGTSILLSFPGFDPILGYPHEGMHLLFENIVPMMIGLWKGKFRDVDISEDPYVLSEETWNEIGRLTVESNPSIPSFFSRPIPNIAIDQHLFTAEAFAFWFIHLAPILLLDRFEDKKYYEHMVMLIKIMKMLLEYEITEEDIQRLDRDISWWVRHFERYYYGRVISKLPLCTLPLHALLHLPQDIRNAGPISGTWSWVMERFCGTLGTVAKQGRRFPNAALSNRIYQHGLINFFENQYDVGIGFIFQAGRKNEHLEEDPDDVGRIEDTDLRLSVPDKTRMELSPTERRRVAKYFPILVNQNTHKRKKVTIKDFEDRLPLTVQRWKKMEIIGGGDTMRGAGEHVFTLANRGGRDNSFVRYTLFPDRHALDHSREDEPMLQVQYGRLAYIIVFDLEPFPQAGEQFSDTTTHRLACVLPCKLLNPGDATEEIVEFDEMEDTPIFVHIGVIECAVGRVRTPTGWSIVDRSGNYARTVFTLEE